MPFPYSNAMSATEIRERIQTAWREVAPEQERNCDWWRSMDEPWRSLARALGIA